MPTPPPIIQTICIKILYEDTTTNELCIGREDEDGNKVPFSVIKQQLSDYFDEKTGEE